jgi:hypothetical protein
MKRKNNNMKIIKYIIKKGSDVNALDKQENIMFSNKVSRDVTFTKNWFYKKGKCECCEQQLMVFHHKHYPFISTNLENVEIA